MSENVLLDTLADDVRPGAGGSPELVPLDPDHPGFRDPVYRARRNAIAKLAFDYVTGDPAPTVSYTDEEHAVWGHVRELLDPRHRDFACAEYLECVDAVALDRTRIPQLEDVNARIRPLTGFRMLPGCRSRDRAGVPVVPRRPDLPGHPVHPAREPSALHPRAGRDPRTRRSRGLLRPPALLRTELPFRPRRPGGERRGRRTDRAPLLVHAGVRGGDRRRRPQGLRCGTAFLGR